MPTVPVSLLAVSRGGEVTIVIGDEEFAASADVAFTFGRADGTGVVGLNPDDMGISAQAGAIEKRSDVWWLANLSTKRDLLVEEAPGVTPVRVGRGDRYAITKSPVVVLVPGAVFTHRLEVTVPDDELRVLATPARPTSGTLTVEDLAMSDKDRDVLTALCSGYLRTFPNRDPRPLTYQRIATALGAPWTRDRVRKQVERFKERTARRGLYFEGQHANAELAEYLVGNEILTAADLRRLNR